MQTDPLLRFVDGKGEIVWFSVGPSPTRHFLNAMREMAAGVFPEGQKQEP